MTQLRPGPTFGAVGRGAGVDLGVAAKPEPSVVAMVVSLIAVIHRRRVGPAHLIMEVDETRRGDAFDP